jgi:hypothetical protein
LKKKTALRVRELSVWVVGRDVGRGEPSGLVPNLDDGMKFVLKLTQPAKVHVLIPCTERNLGDGMRSVRVDAIDLFCFQISKEIE